MSQATFEMSRRGPSPRVAHMISGLSFYRETSGGLFHQRETASLVVPLIISLGTPFMIALGRDAREGDGQPSFAAGLFAGPVDIRSNGRAECVQIDFTPLGAYRFFGRSASELTGRMVDIADILGGEGRALRERIGATRRWPQRFEILEDFVARRATHRPSAEIVFAYRSLAEAGGDARIKALAKEIGWSRKHLVERFKAEIGLAPKSVARIMRFNRACGLARMGKRQGWAMIAAEAGYADQAHFSREFSTFAGESPTAWAGRLGAADPRLARAIDSDAVW